MKTRAVFICVSLPCFFSCTAIIRGTLDDFEDSGADADADAMDDGVTDGEDGGGDDVEPADGDELDFDPDLCGLWGKVTLEEPAKSSVNRAEPELDGMGTFYLGVLTRNYEDSFSIYDTGVDLAGGPGPYYYCIENHMMEGVEKAFISPLFDDIDGELDLDNNHVFRSLIADPAITTLYYAFVTGTAADYRELTDMYWEDYMEPRLDIPLDLRVSQYKAKVEFRDFPGDIVRRYARICTFVYGEGQEDALPLYQVGGAIFNVDDDEVVDNNKVDLNINLALLPQQSFKVYVYFLQNRHLLPEGYDCGDHDWPMSCALKCGRAPESSGGDIINEPVPFIITPIAGECDIDETTPCPDG